MKKKVIDVFDILPSEAFEQIDQLGYRFLKEQGYDVEGATESEARRKELKKELSSNGEELLYSGAFDKETGAVLVWFELHRNKKKAAISQGLKFLPKPTEGENDGEGREDLESQEGPSPIAKDNA